MAELLEGADAMRFYLTGAGSDGGAQTDPNLSIGAFRSSTELVALGITVTNPIANISVDFASGFNGPGDGTLEATGADTLRWMAPGGTAGPNVTILNGQSKVLESGGARSKYVRVSRTTATALAGTATITLADILNNAVGWDDVSSAEAAAGDAEYRMVAMKNVSSGPLTSIVARAEVLGTQRMTAGGQLPASGAGTITISSGTFDDWPAAGHALIKTNAPALREIVYYPTRSSTALTVPAAGRARLGTSAAAGAATDTVDAIPGMAIGLDAPSTQPSGTFEAPANESTAPAGVAFSTPIKSDYSDALSVGTLTAGQIHALCLKRDVAAGAVAILSMLFHSKIRWDGA